MKIKLTSDIVNIEIDLSADGNIYDLANAFRAMAFAVGFSIEDINEAIPSDYDYNNLRD